MEALEFRVSQCKITCAFIVGLVIGVEHTNPAEFVVLEEPCSSDCGEIFYVGAEFCQYQVFSSVLSFPYQVVIRAG